LISGRCDERSLITYVSEFLKYYNSEEKLMKDLDREFSRYQKKNKPIHLPLSRLNLGLKYLGPNRILCHNRIPSIPFSHPLTIRKHHCLNNPQTNFLIHFINLLKKWLLPRTQLLKRKALK